MLRFWRLSGKCQVEFGIFSMRTAAPHVLLCWLARGRVHWADRLCQLQQLWQVNEQCRTWGNMPRKASGRCCAATPRPYTAACRKSGSCDAGRGELKVGSVACVAQMYWIDDSVRMVRPSICPSTSRRAASWPPTCTAMLCISASPSGSNRQPFFSQERIADTLLQPRRQKETKDAHGCYLFGLDQNPPAMQ